MLILSPVNVELYIDMFKIYRVHFNTPNSLTVKHHSKPKGLYDEFFIVPIHMALVSEILIFKPEYFSNMLRLSNRPSQRELKQARRRRQQKPHKFAYLTMKNNSFARFARAFFIFWHFEHVLVLSTTCNDVFCSCVDDVEIWWQMFNFVFLCPKRWFQFNSRMVRTHFSRAMTLNIWKMIAETRSYIFRWRSRFRRRRVSDYNAVMSSAYTSSFVSLSPIVIPFILVIMVTTLLWRIFKYQTSNC